MEDWAEIRRLHRAEQVPIKEIARRLGVARNTVRRALAAAAPRRYERAGAGSLVDAIELELRKLLKDHPRMPATVLAQRLGWTHSLTILKDRVRVIRPEYAGVDPADRLVHEPGEATQCDLWFPASPVPLGHGQVAVGARALPVLTMTMTHSRYLSAVAVPTRQAGDLLAGMWAIIAARGAVTKTLVWDLESAIGKGRRVSAPAAAFAGTLGVRIRLTPPRDPESKGVVERTNGFLETSFLPGRTFASPGDFNAQLGEWLPHANSRLVRSTGTRPDERVEADMGAGLVLPPIAPVVGIAHRVRLARDYYVRVTGNDYSVDPAVIGRFVDVHAGLHEVVVTCPAAHSAGRSVEVARHSRCWANRVTITDPAHVQTAKALRRSHADQRAARDRAEAQRLTGRQHNDGHHVALRALGDYDALYGVDFPTLERTELATTELVEPTASQKQNGDDRHDDEEPDDQEPKDEERDDRELRQHDVEVTR
ncbi:IS21 family transposase [Kineococcus sp. R8]|nr:IS21 family transposase [Kineococcus siccus]